MIKNFKINDSLKTQISIGTFTLVLAVSGFMLGRQYESNKIDEEMSKITNNSEINEVDCCQTDEEYLYKKYTYNSKTNEMVYSGLIDVDVPPKDTNNVHYEYFDTYYEYCPVEDNVMLYVYDKYKVDSNGELKYVGDYISSLPPKDDLHTFYNFKKSITIPEDKIKNEKTR